MPASKGEAHWPQTTPPRVVCLFPDSLVGPTCLTMSHQKGREKTKSRELLIYVLTIGFIIIYITVYSLRTKPVLSFNHRTKLSLVAY